MEPVNARVNTLSSETRSVCVLVNSLSAEKGAFNCSTWDTWRFIHPEAVDCLSRAYLTVIESLMIK